MSRPSFWREVLVALFLSAAGALIWFVLRPWLGGALVLKLLVLALSAAYLLLLPRAARNQTQKSVRAAQAGPGQLLLAGLWLLTAGLLVWLDPVLWLWLLSQSLLLWLWRVLQRGSSGLMALADAGICILALLAAVAAARQSQSLFWALWSFFLVQALWTLLPQSTARNPTTESTPDDRFGAARRSAEAALRRLATRS